MSRPMRRTALVRTAWLAALGWLLASAALPAAAADFPSRPIRIVVPYAAGGTSDIVARRIGQRLSERIGQPVIIDNRGGAGGSIGTEVVTRAEPDGHTILFHSGAVAVDPVSGKKLSYDVQRDLEPITLAVVGPFALLVNLDLPVRSVADLVAYARANPGKLNFGTPGVGTSIHLTSELFKAMAGVDVVHVPYKGASLALTALAANEVQFVFDPLTTAKTLAQGGRVRALAVSTGQRSGFWPELPTVADGGVKGFDLGVWYGIFVPKATPRAVADQLNREFVALLQEPAMRDWLKGNGLDVIASSREEFRVRFASEIERWGRLIREAGVKLQ
jgi:tripartite-type tricarboxylate transporter receptor subunit TctC